MEYRTVGECGLGVSIVGLGCNNFGWLVDKPTSMNVIHAALDAGITFLDTADSYGSSEDILGEALAGRRHGVVVATKFGSPLDAQRRGARPGYVVQALESSLRRLRTDYVDLYQLHRPDTETPIEDTLGALNTLVQQGKVRQIGCSNLSASQIGEARRAAASLGMSGFVSTQNELNMLVRKTEAELGETLDRYKLSLIPFFPLANGLLTGKYKSISEIPAGSRLMVSIDSIQAYRNERLFRQAAALGAYAAQHQRTLVELAFSWLAGRSHVASVIAGATSVRQVKQNAVAVSWRLSPQQLAEIDAILNAEAAP